MPVANQPNKPFHVFMYEDELNYLKRLVLQKPEIETGGDLFGLWQNEHTAVVQLILGPGKGCSRTTTSFHQDLKYLGDVGKYLTTSQGLCNIGAWHSHHTIGLFEPSGGDKQTVWNNMHVVVGGRFLIFIANIVGPTRSPKVKVGCFVFNYANRKIVDGKIKILPTSSPLRDTLNEKYMKDGSEEDQDWETVLANTPFRRSAKSKQPEACERRSEVMGDAENGSFTSEDGDGGAERSALLGANNENKKSGKCGRCKMFMCRICCYVKIFFIRYICCCCECSQEVE